MLQVALPAEITTGTGFLQHYIESILALQEASCRLSEGLSPLNANYYIDINSAVGDQVKHQQCGWIQDESYALCNQIWFLILIG